MGSRPILGIDISRHDWPQGIAFSAIDRLEKSSVEFAICRANYGVYSDGSFEKNITRLKKRKWVVGAYHFLVHGDAAAQAEAFVKHCRSHPAWDSMLVILDVEMERGKPKITATDVKQWVKRFRELAPKKQLGCYTSEGQWNAIGNPDGKALFDYLWQARWTEKGTNSVNDLPDDPPIAGFGGWRGRPPLWQFGMLTISNMKLDGNAWYRSKEELAELGKKAGSSDKDRPAYKKAYNDVVSKTLDYTKTLSVEADTPAGRGSRDAVADVTAAVTPLVIGEE